MSDKSILPGFDTQYVVFNMQKNAKKPRYCIDVHFI